MENIKIGTVIYWNKSGARVYWRTDLNDVVDFLSEEFLEGEDAGHGYTEQFAYDVPHEGRGIPPSVVDNIAGTVAGKSIEINAVIFVPIRFPFTFYNLDGDNHDDSTKSLKVFINAEDISGTTSSTKKQIETKALIDSILANDPVLTEDTAPQSKSSPQKVIIIVGLFIFVIIGGILISRKRRPQYIYRKI